MEIKEIVGIDVSKRTFDAFIHHAKLSEQYENTARGIKNGQMGIPEYGIH